MQAKGVRKIRAGPATASAALCAGTRSFPRRGPVTASLGGQLLVIN